MSEWREDAAARRDERHTKSPEQRRHWSKKDTRRWCRGKVGVEHCGRWENRWTATTPQEKEVHRRCSRWLVFRCQRCNKMLENWWGGDKRYIKPKLGSTEPLKRKEN